MEQESKGLRAPLIILAVVILAIILAVVLKKCPIPVPAPAGEPATPQPTPPVTAPAKVEEVKKVEVQPVDAGSTGPVIDKPDMGLRVGHM